MEDRKKFIFAVVKHLQEDLASGGLSEDAQESLEVGMQCLQQAYGIDVTDSSDISRYQIANSAFQIFNEAKNSSNTSKTPEIDVKRAEEFKLQGNALMKADDFNGAVDCYSKAIGVDRQNAVFYCNRAAAYTKLNRHNDAILDCKEAIRLEPDYCRAYGRLGLAYLNMENFKESVEAYEKALQLDPSNSSYQTNLKIAKDKLSTVGQSGGQAAPAGMPGMPNLGGLDLSSLLSNPAVMNMAQNFMQNPQMQQMFGNMMGAGAADPSQPQQAQATNASQGNAQSQAQNTPPPSFGDIFQATQQYAQQMQEQNPELVDQLKSQFRQHGGGNPDKKPEQ